VSDAIQLNVQPRTVTGKAVAGLRREGLTPIVVYGPNAEPVNLQADTDDLVEALGQAGTTGLVHLNVDGESAPRPVLTRDRQLHPTELRPLHVDFLQVDERHVVRTKVPVRIVGEAPRPVRRNEAVLRVLIEGVEVRSKPDDLPKQIEIDCSAIETLGQVKRVRDLSIPKGVTVLTPGERPVARLAALRRSTGTAGTESQTED